MRNKSFETGVRPDGRTSRDAEQKAFDSKMAEACRRTQPLPEWFGNRDLLPKAPPSRPRQS